MFNIQDGVYCENGIPIESIKDNEWDWNLLPEILREYGQNMSSINLISDKMMGTSILATACASIGRNAFVTPNSKNPTWKERCNLWGVSTAPAGSRKSEAIKKAIAPIFEEQKEIHKEYNKDMEEFKLEEADYKTKKSWYEKQLKIVLETKGNKDKLVRPEQPRRPVKKNYIATDITAERIPSFIAESDGSAFVAYDEMSALFQSTSSKSSRGTGGEARDIYLSAWSGDGFDNRLRQDKTKETNTSGASISIYGMTQPDIIADHVSEYKRKKDGFFPRFQLVTYETKYIDYEENDTPYNQKAADRYGSLISKLLNFKRSNAFYFEGPAAELMKEWLKENKRQLVKYSERKDLLMGEIIAKRTKVVCALALVIHLSEHLELEANPIGSISKYSLERAIKLNEFYINEIKRVVGSEQQKEVDEEETADRVLGWLSDINHQTLLKNGVQASKISDSLRKNGGRIPAKDVKQIALSSNYSVRGGRIFNK